MFIDSVFLYLLFVCLVKKCEEDKTSMNKALLAFNLTDDMVNFKEEKRTEHTEEKRWKFFWIR